MMTTLARRIPVVLLSSMLILAAAGTASAQAPRATGENKLVVFAAASLQDAFGKMAEDFEHAHPGVDVTFNFAGTQELCTELDHGAHADVLASADRKHMDALVASARVVGPVTFARNEPVIVVARENVGKIRVLADLPSVRRIVVGAPEVPIGRYTIEILDRASAKMGADFRSRVEAKVVSRELNVRQVLVKVSLGEADAGIVYRTDARSSGDAVGIVPIPLDINVIAEYPIAVVADANHPVLARAWVDYVTSAQGQRRLRDAGFISPTGGGANVK